jgi:hypothetical protein
MVPILDRYRYCKHGVSLVLVTRLSTDPDLFRIPVQGFDDQKLEKIIVGKNSLVCTIKK